MRRLAIVFVLLLAGCAYRNAGVGPDWVGRDIAEVVEKRGPPSRTINLLSGDSLYVWEHSVLSALEVVSCSTRVQVDRNGRIVNGSRRYDSIFC